MKTRNYVLIYINGKKHKIYGEDVFQPLSDYLRYEQQNTGTKVVCAEGDCGSCTVVQGSLKNNEMNYHIINSCIKYLYQLDASHIITIEGLRNNHSLNPVQEAMVKNHGAQCGFCTPGFVVAMSSLLEKKEKLNEQELKTGLTGNLCRCTGYRSIIEAGLDLDTSKYQRFDDLYPQDTFLSELKESTTEPVLIEAGDKKFFKPSTTAQATAFLEKNREVTMVAGGTDIGVQLNKHRSDPGIIMSTLGLEELKVLHLAEGVLKVGALVSLAELEQFIKDKVPELAKILNIFGSPQIKNAGTLAGNIANASPIADTLPFLFVCDAELEITGSQGSRRININHFYKGYKLLSMSKNEMISNIFISLPKKEILKLYKVSRRRDLDISAFTAAFLMELAGNKITHINIAYGGVAPTVVRLPATEQFLQGKLFNEENLQQAGKIAISEITPISDVRGSKDFRLALAENIMMKFYFECIEKETVLCQQ